MISRPTVPHSLRLSLVCHSALLTVLCLGCGDSGPARIGVSGTATLDGEPVSAGYLSIVPLESGPASSAEVTDGQFAVDRNRGPVAGEYRFRLTMPLQKPITNPEEPPPDEFFETTASVRDSSTPVALRFTRE